MTKSYLTKDLISILIEISSKFHWLVKIKFDIILLSRILEMKKSESIENCWSKKLMKFWSSIFWTTYLKLIIQVGKNYSFYTESFNRTTLNA